MLSVDTGLSGQRFLLVEDDVMLGQALYDMLSQRGAQVTWHQNGDHVKVSVQSDAYDILILDVGLPRRSGFDVLADLRGAGCDIPVLMLTARDHREDRIRGLEEGADDYVLKPFDLDELLARLRALLRRSQGRASARMSCGRIQIDTRAMQVFLDQQPVTVSRQEYRLLSILVERAGQVLTRDRLESVLLEAGGDIESNSLEVHVHHLRKKLYPELIRTLRGVGYMVTLP